MRKENISEALKIPEAWLVKRKHTQRIFIIQALLLGVEYSIFFLTLWIYINTLVTTSNAKVLYSFTSTAYLGTAIFISPLVGKIVDKTRNVRVALLLGNIAIIIGNITYTLHYSQYCLLFGRIIAGFGVPIKSVIFSELARSYTPENLASQISVVGTAFGCGFLVGPALNFIFMKTDFYIGSLHMTVGNVAGFYLAFIFMIQQIFVYFFVHNLSKEFDLKAKYETVDMLTNNHDTNNREVAKDPNQKESGTINANIIQDEATISDIVHAKDGEKSLLLNSGKQNGIIKKRAIFSILTNIDVLIILTFTFFQMYIVTSMDLILPILIIDIIKWSILELNIFAGGISLIGISCMVYISWKSVSQRSLYYIFLLSLIAMVTIMIFFSLIVIYKNNIALVIALLSANGIMFSNIMVSAELALVIIFAKMIPSEIQTFGDSIRLAFQRAGSMLALLTSVYMLDYIVYYVIAFSIIAPIGLALSIYRKTYFINNFH